MPRLIKRCPCGEEVRGLCARAQWCAACALARHGMSAGTKQPPSRQGRTRSDRAPRT